MKKQVKLSIATPKKGQVKETLMHVLFIDKHEAPNTWKIHVTFNSLDVATLNVQREEIIKWYDFAKVNAGNDKVKADYWHDFVNDRIEIINGAVYYK